MDEPYRARNNVRVPRAYSDQNIHAQTIITFVLQEHTNGNAAWEAACLDRGLDHRPVTHQLKIFAAPCQTPGNLTNMAGTQCIDKTWLSLNVFLGQELLLKHKSKPLNEEAKKHVRMYAFRANLLALHGPDVFKPKLFLAQLQEIV